MNIPIGRSVGEEVEEADDEFEISSLTLAVQSLTSYLTFLCLSFLSVK